MAKKANIPAPNTNDGNCHRTNRLLIFVIPLLLLLLLMAYSHFYPPLDMRLENNTTIIFDVDRVEKIITDNRYVVNGVIISFPDNVSLKEGECISVAGVYRDGALQVEKYHIHKYYRIKYFLSLLGLPVLLYYMRKEWKFDLHTFCFKGR